MTIDADRWQEIAERVNAFRRHRLGPDAAMEEIAAIVEDAPRPDAVMPRPRCQRGEASADAGAVRGKVTTVYTDHSFIVTPERGEGWGLRPPPVVKGAEVLVTVTPAGEGGR